MSDVVFSKVDEIITDLAHRYAEQGYYVEIRPIAQRVLGQPIPFVYVLDMVASNSNETVVVEVSSQQKLATYPGYLTALTRVVTEKPGWRLEMIMYNEPIEPEMLLVELPVLTREEVATRLDQAAVLLQQGQAQAAFLKAWEAAAGLMRQVIIERNDDINVSEPMPLYGAVEASVSIFFIDQPAGLRYFSEAADRHDEVVRGTLPADFDLATYTTTFIERVRGLLHQSTQPD